MKKTILLLLSIFLFINLFSQNNSQKANNLFSQAKENISKNNFQEAIKEFREASSIYQKEGLTQNYVISQISLLDLLINLGNINEASPIATEIKPTAIAQFGEKSNLVAHLYTLLGRIEFISSQYNQSKKDLLKSLKLTQELSGAGSFKSAMVMSDLALLYANIGNIDSAIYYNKENIKIITKLQGENSPNLIYSLINLSNIYITIGKYDAAINMKMRIIKIINKTKGTESEEEAEAYSGIGTAYFSKGEYKLAEEYLLKSNNIFKKLYGENSPKLVTNYINLGNLYSMLQNYDFSLQYYFLATKILEKNNSQNNIFPGLYNNIGLVCKNQGNLQNAEIYFNKALESKEATGTTGDYQTGVILTNLASVYHYTKKRSLAIRDFRKAIKVFRKLYGEHNPNIINPYLNLANLYSSASNNDSALFYIIKSINSNYKNYNYFTLDQKIKLNGYFDGIRLLQSIKSISAIYLSKYKQDSATADLYKAYKYINLGDKLISDLRKSYFAKEDKLRLNSEISEIFDDAIEICYLMYTKKLFDNNKNFIDKIYYFMERNKTSTLLQALKNSKLQKVADVPDSLLKKENKIRKNINIYNQKISEATTDQEENFYREKLITQQQNYKNIILYYKKNYPDYYNAKYNVVPVKVSNLQKMIDDQTAIVNYAVTNKTLFAFIITKDSKNVLSIPFGEKDKLDINDMNKSLLSYKPKDIEKYVKLGSKLFNKLFFFILPKKIKDIVIIPSGIIGTVPFEALLTHKYTEDYKDINLSSLPYLIKKYAISYSYSSTLLYETMNMDYSNIDREDILAVAPVFKPDNPQTFNFNDIETIIGTEKEVKDIQALAKENGLSSVILLNKNANEYKFKQLVNQESFKIIHIATHGFVNFVNPELSALILAKDKYNIEDGILYSGEIYNLKLKSELITLSACETARGKFSKGEGVIGLSRAFIYAGAKNLIISLWKVSDISTTLEMKDFYSHLFNEYPKLKGQVKFSKALQQAKLDLINSKFSHPYFWSPFILIGM